MLHNFTRYTGQGDRSVIEHVIFGAFLWIGVTYANFRFMESAPVFSEALKIRVQDLAPKSGSTSKSHFWIR